ncbi:MAG TPA: hypothetical protein VF618_03335 [Thermoanaerobaculia bacterium]
MIARVVAPFLRLLGEERRSVVLQRLGRRRIAELVLPNPTKIEGTAIVAFFHVGPFYGISAYVDRLGRDFLGIRRQPDEQQRALAFARAVQKLREGGLVSAAFDGEFGARMAVPFRGGTLRLARGAFALARITGAPIVPLWARWRGSRIEIIVGEPLSAGSEEALAAAAAAWLERQLDGAPLSRRLRDLTS